MRDDDIFTPPGRPQIQKVNTLDYDELPDAIFGIDKEEAGAKLVNLLHIAENNARILVLGHEAAMTWFDEDTQAYLNAKTLKDLVEEHMGFLHGYKHALMVRMEQMTVAGRVKH